METQEEDVYLFKKAAMVRHETIWLFGGRARQDAVDHPAWAIFDRAMLIELEDGVETRRFEYAGTDIERKLGISRCFKAASVHEDHILACTNTEVLRISIDTFSIVDAWTHPMFNDLHHVTMIGDIVYVVSTGIDSVLEFDSSMRFRRRIPVAGDEIISRFGEGTDFRRIPSTKPHASHPNYVASFSDRTWVTRLTQSDVIDLSGSRSHVLADVPVHDGVPAFGVLWFTAVKGSIIRLDPESGATRTNDLIHLYPRSRRAGWCRGILPLSEQEAIVGFSKLRPTKQTENIRWIQSSLASAKYLIKQPTHIAQFDLQGNRIVWSRELASEGMDAIFSINRQER
jgi:hypothetical protein